MALLMAEHGIKVLLNDPSKDTVNGLLETAKEDGIQQDMLEKHLDYSDLCQNLGSPKVYTFAELSPCLLHLFSSGIGSLGGEN